MGETGCFWEDQTGSSRQKLPSTWNCCSNHESGIMDDYSIFTISYCIHADVCRWSCPDNLPLHIAMATPFCRSTLSTILCIKDQYIMIQYSVLQNCIVQYSVVQYNTELPCNVHHCTTVQLSALHDTVQDKLIFNSAGVSSKPKKGIILKVNFWNVGQFGWVAPPPF